ncbi:MAG: hypothetical protein EOP88_10245 [Verrucomicrobiaceae bacterium]|nr:MAG: hypothetical protein EOP88_10245 [Verrucomicrobiaceae bacterium]
MKTPVLFPVLRLAALLVLSCDGLSAAPEGKMYRLEVRASGVDAKAKAHPEISFLLEKDGKPQDVEHAAVDTRVPPQGKLVIWLMGHNGELFDRVTGYGMHAIQVHYAREWFGKLYPGAPPRDELFLSGIRLEAATGKDESRAVRIPYPDSIMGRSVSLVKWLEKENPEGNWKQFLTRDGKDLQWEKVVLCGISHGATTAARMAKTVKVGRVVMFSGPRDQFEVWQRVESATPGNRYFGFTHLLDDGWSGDHYSRSWQLMQMQKYGPVTDVEKSPPPYGNSRRLITTADVKGDAGRAHNAVVPGGAAVKDAGGKYLHEEVWRYLFTSDVEKTGEAVAADKGVRMDQRGKKKSAE